MIFFICKWPTSFTITPTKSSGTCALVAGTGVMATPSITAPRVTARYH